jgi:hypothetical protein
VIQVISITISNHLKLIKQIINELRNESFEKVCKRELIDVKKYNFLLKIHKNKFILKRIMKREKF